MKRRFITPYLMLFPSLMLALTFSLLPFSRSLILSFFRIAQNGSVLGFAGLENFSRLIGNEAFNRAVRQTLIFTALFLPLNTLFTLTAASLTRRKRKHSGIFEFIFLSPIAVSLAAYSMIFSEMFRGRISIINRILSTDILWLESPETAMLTLVFLSVFLDFGLDYILLLSAFRSLDKNMIEAAELDGAGSLRVLFSIEIPNIKHMIAITLFMAAKDALLISAPVMILTGGGPYRSTETIMYYYYLEAFRSSNIQAGRAISVLMVFISIILMALGMRRKKDV